MSQTTTISVNVDEELRQDVEIMLDRLGMNINLAVNMLFKQILVDEGLPFRPKSRNKQKFQTVRHIPLKERLKDYEGDYNAEEWETGTPVGREEL